MRLAVLSVTCALLLSASVIDARTQRKSNAALEQGVALRVGAVLTAGSGAKYRLERLLHISKAGISDAAHAKAWNDYQTQKLLGAGSFGKVWAATALNAVHGLAVNTRVAIKLADQSLQHEFDMQTAAYSKCKDFVPIAYEQGSFPSGYYLVMELMDGKLAGLKQHKAEFCAHRTALWISLFKGLKCLQDNKIYNFDVKGDNVLFRHHAGAAFDVKFADWGLGRKLATDSPAIPTGWTAAHGTWATGTVAYLPASYPRPVHGSHPYDLYDRSALALTIIEAYFSTTVQHFLQCTGDISGASCFRRVEKNFVVPSTPTFSRRSHGPSPDCNTGPWRALVQALIAQDSCPAPNGPRDIAEYEGLRQVLRQTANNVMDTLDWDYGNRVKTPTAGPSPC